MCNRRVFLGTAFAAGAAVGVVGAGRAEEDSPSLPLIDTNVSLFQWPFRRLPLDRTDRLVQHLTSLGIQQSWAGSFEALLHRDVRGVNERLVEECQSSAMLMPVGCVNPALPGWRRDFDDCVSRHGLSAIRIIPGYHGYTLNDDCAQQLLHSAAEAGVLLQIAVSMEDTRTQPALVRVPDVDPAPLLTSVPRLSGLRVQLLNHRLRGELCGRLGALSGLWFDTARVDGTDGVPALVRTVTPRRVLFGSHAPFLIPESALIRTYESGRLDRSALQDVLFRNARKLMEGR